MIYIILGLILLAFTPPVNADMPMVLLIAFVKVEYWWVVPLAILIEMVAIRWIFEFSWWIGAAFVSLVVNLATFFLGFFLYPFIGSILYPALSPTIISLTSRSGYLELGYVELLATLVGTSIVDTLVELVPLRFIFKAKIQFWRASLFLLANLLTTGILFATIVLAK